MRPKYIYRVIKERINPYINIKDEIIGEVQEFYDENNGEKAKNEAIEAAEKEYQLLSSDERRTIKVSVYYFMPGVETPVSRINIPYYL